MGTNKSLRNIHLLVTASESGHVFVDNTSAAIDQNYRLLKNKFRWSIIMMFPEGARTMNGMGRFKKGHFICTYGTSYRTLTINGPYIFERNLNNHPGN